MMRFTPAAVSLAVLLAVTSSVTVGQQPAGVDADSLAWSEKGAQALAAGKLAEATNAFEAALVLDPRNKNAFIGVARVAEAQDLPGKAIRYYDEALQLDPSNVVALKGQGLAMVEKGAYETARGNLTRIKSACKTGCAAMQQLASAITSAEAEGGTRMVATDPAKHAPAPGGKTKE